MNTTVNAIRYALVTGGSRGIGRAICLRLAREGYSIIINYRSDSNAGAQVKAAIEAEGGKAELLPFDVCDSESVAEALTMWQNSHSGEYISVLINNAGIRQDNILSLMNNKQWHDVVNTTLTGFYNTTSLLVQKMMRKRSGRIINIASVSGMMGLPGQSNYSAAKAGLIGATKALAKELAPRGITVNAVAPGFIETDMTSDLDRTDIEKSIPAGRFGTPDEVAALVAFLVGNDASYITGQCISINGGLYT